MRARLCQLGAERRFCFFMRDGSGEIEASDESREMAYENASPKKSSRDPSWAAVPGQDNGAKEQYYAAGG